MRGKKDLNLLGIDFEDWYHPELVEPFVSEKERKPTMFKGLDKILELLRKNDSQATFFTVGELLESNPENFEDLSSLLNPNSLQIKNGFVESNLSNAKIEMAYQFEREGYFCRDSESENKLVFNKTVGLRDSYE